MSGFELMNQQIKARQRIDGVVSRFIHSLNRQELSDEEKFSAVEKNDLLSPEKPADNQPVSETVKNFEIASGKSSSVRDVEIENLAEDGIEKNTCRINGEKKPNIEEIKEMDRDLRDSKLKLVRFKVLFIKRDYEHAFEESEDLISTNIDGSGFAAWKIAEFIQRLAQKQTRVPEKWLKKNYPPPEYRAGSMLIGLPDKDKKYLRVYHQVLDRYQREKFEYEEEQIDVLREIRDGIRKNKKT